MPSDTLGLDRTLVLGIAADAGGKTSHTAILARAGEIPAVLGLSDISRCVKTGDEVIVDGNRGTVIVAPDEATRALYDERRRDWERTYLMLKEQRDLPAETVDGKRLSIEANIEVPEEADGGPRPRGGRHRAVPLGVPLHPAQPLPDRGRAGGRLHVGAQGDGRPHGHHPHPGPRR